MTSRSCFCYTFRKIGGGSDPSVTNITLFLMKASLIEIIRIIPKEVSFLKAKGKSSSTIYHPGYAFGLPVW